MLKKKIKLENAEAIQEAIKAAEGLATARTITAEEIREICTKVEIVNGFHIPKKYLDGTRIHYNGGQKFPSAYKYTPNSTQFEAVFIKNSWYLISLKRDICPNSNTAGKITYSETAKQYILENIAKL